MKAGQWERTEVLPSTPSEVLRALARACEDPTERPVADVLYLVPMIEVAIRALREMQFTLANRAGLAGVFVQPPQVGRTEEGTGPCG